jgi:hypothetical protein
MTGGRLDNRFELGSLIQGFNTQNMIFWKTSEIKTNHKIFFEELEFFQIIFTKDFVKNLYSKKQESE